MGKHFKLVALLLSGITVLSLCSSMVALGEGETAEKIIATGNREVEVKPNLNYESEQAFLEAMEQVSSNQKTELYFDKNSLSIAVKNKANNELYFSNPYNAQKDPFYTGNIAKALNSQVQLNYADSNGAIQTLYSSSDCFEIGQWEAALIDNGITVRLSIGKEKDKMVVPLVISVERFETLILDKLADDAKAVRRLKSLYKKEETVYRSRKLNDREIEEVEQYIKKAGYTYQDLEKDNSDNNIDAKKVVSPNFKVTVEYILTDQGLQVTVPADKIEFDRKNFNLISIKLLEYFGAVSSTQNNEGYILMPDGCGTIIPFDDKTPNRQSVIAGDVYGFDTSVTYPVIPRQGSQYYLPVFGIKKNNTGMFAIVTQGDALTKLSAYAGAHFGNYFTAFPTFQYTTRENLELDQKVTSHNSATQVYLYDNNYYRGNYSITYSLLSQENSSYAGMAVHYREYLKSLGMKKSDDALKHFLSVETLGTVNVTERFLGLPYTSAVKLTTFQQNQKMIEEIRGQGVENVVLTLESWRKNGLEYSAANRFDPSSALGGKHEFEELQKWCNDNEVPFYPNVDFAFVARDRFFDGFSANSHTSRMLNDKFGGLMKIRPDTSMYDKKTFKFALSPVYYEDMFGKLMKSYQKVNPTSLGLSSLGNFVSADYNDKAMSNRVQTTDTIKKMLSDVSDKMKLSFEGGNAYVLPSASYIQKIPMSDSNYQGTKEVPFIQLVLNGHVGYSSNPINFEHDETKALLKCIETGASPHFLLAYDNTIKLKQTSNTNYYSIGAKNWMNTAIEGYRFVDKALSQVKDSMIVDHEYLEDDVVKVSYDNGVSVLVNYGKSEYAYKDITLQPCSAQAVKGGA